MGMENRVVSFVPKFMWLLNVVRWVIVVFGGPIIVWLSMINTKTASWPSLVGRTEDKVASHTQVERKPRCCSQLLISLFSCSLRVSQHIPKRDGFLRSLMQMFSISSFAWGPLEMPHSRPCGTPSWEFMKSSGGLYETRVTWTKKIMVALCLGFQNSRVESLLKSTATNLKMEFAIFSLFARTRQDRWWWGLTEAPRMWIWITKSGLSFSKNVSYGAE